MPVRGAGLALVRWPFSGAIAGHFQVPFQAPLLVVCLGGKQGKPGGLVVQTPGAKCGDRGQVKRALQIDVTEGSGHVCPGKLNRSPLPSGDRGAEFPTSLHSLASGMTVFDGSNFSEWYERVQFSLGVLDLDLALITDKPPEATDDSTPEQVEQSKAWARSNRLSLMFMRMTIANNIKTSLPQTEFASEFLKSVEERFKRTDKSLVAKLKALGMGMDESFLWNLNELTSKCIQEEVRLRQEGHNLALAVTHGVTKKKGKFKKGKNFPPKKSGPGEGSRVMMEYS
ncbi:hypothetical protein CK203_025590 [Vitis vinifera]|uniref:Uncharacterized protein n=1 Tax=Vitis vinifera TaxID=29760 RepID=A0A438IET4_VITVI|nr:hypothetical protein CK203_025590 [Vitis vinifera]